MTVLTTFLNLNRKIETIRNMNLYKANELCYLPAYTRTDITDTLHNKFKLFSFKNVLITGAIVYHQTGLPIIISS